MALAYTYHDAYLSKFCDEALEARALADVEVLADGRTFSADWLERVTVPQAYVLVCMDRQAEPDDLFAAKLKTYREVLEKALPQAIADADATSTTVSAPYNFPVYRS